MPEGVIELELCAPERDPIALEVNEAIIPGAGGVFTVQHEHTPLLSKLLPGVVVAYCTDGQELHFAVDGGFAEVIDDRVVVLTDTMEPGDEIDTERAEEAKQRAEQRLGKSEEDVDITRAEAALSRALARIQAHGQVGYN